MSSGVWTQLAAHESAHTQMIDSLSVGSLNLFSTAWRSVRNFAIEDKRSTIATQSLAGEGAQDISFNLDGILLGDFVNACHLEIQLPALADRTLDSSSAKHQTTLASYVWGAGYAMIESAQISIEGEVVEQLAGDYMELHHELHTPPGQGLKDATFKFDRVTVPELAALSKVPRTLYVPIPFFFTRGPHCVLPVGKNFDRMVGRNVRVEVELHLRAVKEFAIDLPKGHAKADETTPSLGGTSIGTPTTSTATNNAAATNLQWSEIPVQLYVQQVYLEDAESQAMWLSGGASGTYRAMCTTVQSLNRVNTAYSKLDSSSHEFDRKKLPLRFPTKNLILAVADTDRLTRTLTSELKLEPFKPSGITSLYGAKANHSVDVTSGTVLNRALGTGASYAITDWNVLKEGSSTVAVYDHDAGSKELVYEGVASDKVNVAGTNYPLTGSKDVKEWRADGQAQCLFLPGNRFDYRAADGSGNEVEPLKELCLKLNGQERITVGEHDHHPSYLRTVQAMTFNQRPRKGIYVYSFALDSSSPYPTGTINLSRIHNKDLTLKANGAGTRELILFSEHINIFEIAAGGSAGRMMYSA